MLVALLQLHVHHAIKEGWRSSRLVGISQQESRVVGIDCREKGRCKDLIQRGSVQKIVGFELRSSAKSPIQPQIAFISPPIANCVSSRDELDLFGRRVYPEVSPSGMENGHIAGAGNWRRITASMDVAERVASMTDEKFDIIFCAELVAGTDQIAAQANLQRSFGLSDEALKRLFQGRPVSIKRGVDTEVAEHYRRLFRAAGALVRIDPVAPIVGASELDERIPPAAAEGESSAVEYTGLSLSTDTGYLEELVEQPAPEFDLSYLSLETAEDWTLEDCEPPTLPLPFPDISHLSLVADGSKESR